MKLNKLFVKVLMFLIMGSLISGSAFAVNSSNLEACWSYDSTYNDLTTNGWDLNNVGTTFLTGSNCKIGDCVEFTSGDRLTTGTLFNGFTSTSISFWMYSPSYSEPYQSIINNDISNPNVVFQTQYADLRPFFAFSDGTTTTSDASGSISLSTSTWYHIVLTNSGNGINNLYINGAYVTSTGTAGSSGRVLKTSTHDTWIGAIEGLSRPFVGRMDEFMIFEQTLSLSEIQELYNSNNALSCDDVLTLTPTIKHNTQEYYNTSSISINLNTKTNTNMSYSLDSGTETSIVNDSNSTTLILNSLSEGLHNIIYISTDEDGQTNTSANFTIDLTNPEINNSIPLEINSYEFSSDYFSCTDTNLLSCNISIDSLNKDSETNFDLTHNGNLSYTITAIDLAGNIATESSYVFVDPEFFVYFNNNTVNLENFTVNDIFYEEYFTGTIYDYGLGVNNFTFKKTGYEEIEFQLNFTDNYTNLNQTIFTNQVYINIQLKNIFNGSEAPNNDYLIFISDESGNINTYQITNDNEITIENLYSQDTQIQISVVLNETLSNTFELVSTRQNASIEIYLNFQTTSPRIIEVKTSSLIAIPNIDVFLYKFIQGEGFVLETVKETNVLGQVFFNIIENTAIYNVCAVYQEEEACLSQVTFQNAETDPYEIIFSTEYKVIERDYLDFISWSFSEDKNFTTETSQMTYTFQDAQAIVENFCYEVYRTTNTTETYLGEFCNENSAGQVVQTFTLEENQKLTYIFNFYIAGDKKILNTYTSYGENALLSELIDNSIIDIIFLVLIFGLISLSLSFNNFTFYNLSFLGGSIVILIIQAYVNQNYMTSLIWTFLFLKTLVLYMTKVEK